MRDALFFRSNLYEEVSRVVSVVLAKRWLRYFRFNFVG